MRPTSSGFFVAPMFEYAHSYMEKHRNMYGDHPICVCLIINSTTKNPSSTHVHRFVSTRTPMFHLFSDFSFFVYKHTRTQTRTHLHTCTCSRLWIFNRSSSRNSSSKNRGSKYALQKPRVRFRIVCLSACLSACSGGYFSCCEFVWFVRMPITYKH